MTGPAVVIFESHPVQYKVPVYQVLQQLVPGAFEVVFATDVSVKGYRDEGFGKTFAWDIPLMEGYPHRVLHNEREDPFTSRRGLSGRGVFRLFWQVRPRAVLLTQLRYNFDFSAYLSALVLGIPIWIRQETQDEMFAAQRSWAKGFLRSLVYRVLYFPVRRAFCFGVLNREHLLRHGIPASRLRVAHFSVPDPLRNVPETERAARRESRRGELGFHFEDSVVAFFGKLIPKKNPALILEAWTKLPETKRDACPLMFVGSGELEDALRRSARAVDGLRMEFTGFINQSKLPDYYLAADIVVLPSRRMGEAWGLVVNEALQAGCAVVITDAVGSHREFGDWERVRVISEGDAVALAGAIEELSAFSRDFHWADELMRSYSTEAAAEALAAEIRELKRD